MGANISTVEDSKAAVVAPPKTVSHAVYPPTYNPNNPNNRAYGGHNINFSCGYSENRPTNYSANYKIRAPAAALLPSSRVPNSHRIITFHSSPSFRGYLEASKASNTLIVIIFVNRWCGRCRSMEPTLHEFAARNTHVEFVKIDADELHDVSREFGVHTTPTFFLVKKGRLLDRVDGAKKEELQVKIETHINV